MLLDKRRVGIVTKVGAVVIALAFIMTYIPFLTGSFSGGTGSTDQQTPQQQMATTINALEQAVQKDPKIASNWIQLGNAYYDANIWEKAAAAYEKGIALDPKNVKARVDMSIAYYGMGQVDTATATASEAVKLDPKFSPAYYNLGVFYASAGKNQEAIDAYENYIKLDPKGTKVSDTKSRIEVLKKELKKK